MPVKLDLAASTADGTTRHTLRNISLAVAKSKRIVVVTGAGVSCSSGIPDFRSSDGLYNLVKQKYPDVVLKGRDLFDASLFRDPVSTSVFYTFISQLKQSIDAAVPSPTHRFIKTLDSKKRLLRSYTQNIDGLEERIGLVGSSNDSVKASTKGKTKLRTRDVRNVQLHGDIHRVRCTFCAKEYPCTPEHLHAFGNGISPDCPECTSRSEARVARSARALKIGNLRPAIVLYDEPHPLGDDIGLIQATDVNKKPDMLIIMGTSLKVHGLKKLVKDFAKAVHASASSKSSNPALARADLNAVKESKVAGPSKQPAKASPKNAKNLLNSLAGRVIFVNRTPPGSEWDGIIDYWIEGECDAWVKRVEDEWRSMRPGDWEVQQTLDATGGFTAAKAKNAGGSKITKAAIPSTDGRSAEERENIPVEPQSSVPSTPSKRRKRVPHYPSSEDADTDVECSPSKRAAKRGNETLTPTTAMTERVKKLALEGDQSMHMPERRKLFRELLNAEDRHNRDLLAEESSDLTDDDAVDNPLRLKSTQSEQSSQKALSKTLKSAGTKGSRSASKARTRPKVEVVIDASARSRR